MLKRLFAILLCTQLLAGCEIDTSQIFPEIKAFLKDVDIGISSNGDPWLVTVNISNDWVENKWYELGAGSYVGLNKLGKFLDVVTVMYIGVDGKYIPLSRTVCDSDYYFGACAAGIRCRNNGTMIDCQALSNDTVMFPIDKPTAFFAGANVKIKAVTCTTDLDIVPTKPDTCSYTEKPLHIRK